MFAGRSPNENRTVMKNIPFDGMLGIAENAPQLQTDIIGKVLCLPYATVVIKYSLLTFRMLVIGVGLDASSRQVCQQWGQSVRSGSPLSAY